MKKIILTVLLIVSLSACLKDNKLDIKIDKEVLNENQEKALIISYEEKDYKLGDNMELDLSTELDSKLIAFDLIFDKEKLSLSSITKTEFTEGESFVSSEEISNGYRIIFSDLKNDLKKDANFANIFLNVKWTGAVDIKIENLLEEN